MPDANALENIKKDLESFVGTKVKLIASQGRKKVVEAEGVLEKTYPRIFVVRVNDKPGVTSRVSYSYADLLTEAVKLTVGRGADEEKRIGCTGA